MRVAFNGRGRLLGLPSRLGSIVFLEWKKKPHGTAILLPAAIKVNRSIIKRAAREGTETSGAILPGDFLPASRATQSSHFTHRPGPARPLKNNVTGVGRGLWGGRVEHTATDFFTTG